MDAGEPVQDSDEQTDGSTAVTFVAAVSHVVVTTALLVVGVVGFIADSPARVVIGCIAFLVAMIRVDAFVDKAGSV